LKILLLSHKFYPDTGGIETTSEMLASAIFAAGHEIHILTWSKNFKTNKFPFNVIRNPNVVRLFQEYAWADIFFENNPCLQLAWPGIFFGRPSIVALHTWLSRTNGNVSWKDKLKMKRLKNAVSVIACSDAIRKQNFPSAIVINNPYNEIIFKQIADIPKNLDFVFLGRLVSDKGADMAIRAFYEIFSATKDNAHLSLTIIGDGPEFESLTQLVYQLNIGSNVKFTGKLHGHELAFCLNQHKYLLVPSIWEEPFGIVALEGMACGCIPIVSNGGGLPDAVGNAGLIFRRGDVDDLVNTIRRVLKSKALQTQLLNAAQLHLKLHYTDVIAKKYLDVIEAAVSKH
jgi:glycosyltransferase involved in cell wall biosynthesis